MQAIQIKAYVKHVNELAVSKVEIPTLAKDQVLVQVHSAAANFFDILQVQGKYQTQPPFPWNAGFEFAGTIVKAPPGSPYKEGARVFGGAQGAYAEYISVSLKTLLPIPAGVTFEEASTLFVTAPTSYLALYLRGKLQKGETCLVHAGAGGVGLMAVQMAKAIGATVIATASTAEKLAVCKRFGADVVINYTDHDWIEQVKKVTKGKGCDVIYDPVGMVDKSLKVVAWNGRILIVGFAAGQIEKIAMNKALLKQASLIGVFWGGSTIQQPHIVPGVWKGILTLLSQGKLKATVFDKVYDGLQSVPEALESLGSRGTWGKVVIRIKSADSKL
ncbi:hypothetical protein HDV03_001940 [Kappamyces sp. JEL0829]|nr:hypothetical protein HDV03_001940 [Kappamyces sp. JEL0829]